MSLELAHFVVAPPFAESATYDGAELANGAAVEDGDWDGEPERAAESATRAQGRVFTVRVSDLASVSAGKEIAGADGVAYRVHNWRKEGDVWVIYARRNVRGRLG